MFLNKIGTQKTYRYLKEVVKYSTLLLTTPDMGPFNNFKVFQWKLAIPLSE